MQPVVRDKALQAVSDAMLCYGPERLILLTVIKGMLCLDLFS